MAIQYLKKGITEQERSTEDNKVKNIVEETLKKIEQQGDHYIRAVSYTHLTLPTNREV